MKTRVRTAFIRKTDGIMRVHSTALSVLSVAAMVLTVWSLEERFRNRNAGDTASSIEGRLLWCVWFVNLLTAGAIISYHVAVRRATRREPLHFESHVWTPLGVLLELLANCLSPLPGFTRGTTAFDAHEAIALCVFLRFYHFFRLMRDVDDLYLRRRQLHSQLKVHCLRYIFLICPAYRLLRSPAGCSAFEAASLRLRGSTQVSPRFDSLLVFKRFVHRFGFRFCMIVFAVLLFVGSYAVYLPLPLRPLPSRCSH